MTTSLIISTYENPAFLRLVLETAARQTEAPDQIIIADDGSGPETARLIADFAARSAVPVIHVHHPDKGFRKTIILNKALLRATSDYIIFTDGDILIHPHFIADHKRFARPGCFVTGSRVKLSPSLTASILASGKVSFCPFGLGKGSPLNGLRLPWLTPLTRNHKSADGTYARGCNMAAWRRDLAAVNGFNNDITGWGREDSELSWRLINLGLRKSFLKFGAVEYHLHHPEYSRELDARNYAIMEKARCGEVVRAACGLDNIPGD